MNTLLFLSLLLFSLDLEDYGVEIDSAKVMEYFAPILEPQADSILLLGEVSVFGWDYDSNFVMADKGVVITLHDGNQYISVETGKNGLFSVIIPHSVFPGYFNIISLVGFMYGGLLISTEAIGLGISPISGIAFARGGCRLYTTKPIEGEIPDTMCLWGYEFSDSLATILQDFCVMHPNHEFAPVAKSLIEDIKFKTSIDSLTTEGQFNAANDLLINALDTKPESEYLLICLLENLLEWAKMPLSVGDTTQALQVLRVCFAYGDNMGVQGRLLKLLLFAAVTGGRYTAPFEDSEKECDFGDEIELEIQFDFVSMFLDDRQLFAVKFSAYKQNHNYEKAEEICYDWLSKYPNDSLPYQGLIDLYNSIDFTVDSTCIDKIIKVGKDSIKRKIPMSEGTFISLGDMCYGQKRYKDAVNFYETEPGILDQLYFHTGYYIISLNRIGNYDKAKRHFEEALQSSSETKLRDWAKFHIFIPSTIDLRLESIVDSLYSKAESKFSTSDLEYLKTTMAQQYFEIKDKDNGFQMLTEVLQDDSTNATAWQILGDYYASISVFDSSEICYKKVLGYTRNEYAKIDAALKLADLHLNSNKTSDAGALLKDFLEENKDDPLYSEYVKKIKKWCKLNKTDDIFLMLSPLFEPQRPRRR